MTANRLAASDKRLAEDWDNFNLTLSRLLDVDSGIDDATIRLRRFAIDGSVLIVAESYDDGVATIALTEQQAHVLGDFLR